MKEQQPLTRLTLKVPSESLAFLATILQSGVEIDAENGTSLGRLLGRLPGFSADYLSEVVQTIFLNGTAVDDLTTALAGERAVLALSAAMPGLAGAIFRKNSFHAALRTTTEAQPASQPQTGRITVVLKLFNRIALDRGEDLLRQGVRLKAATLADFLERRPDLRRKIRSIKVNDRIVQSIDLAATLAGHDRIHLTVEDADD